MLSSLSAAVTFLALQLLYMLELGAILMREGPSEPKKL